MPNYVCLSFAIPTYVTRSQHLGCYTTDYGRQESYTLEYNRIVDFPAKSMVFIAYGIFRIIRLVYQFFWHVYMEFNRVVGKNLKQEFYESIDQHSLRLIEIFQSKRGNIGQLLSQLSQQTKTKEPTDIRTLVLRGLPIVLGDSPADFYKECSDSDDSFGYLDVALLSPSPHLSPASLKIIIEGEVVMDNIQDLPKAMCILFGLTYALHLNYHKSMRNTFQFIQQVLLSLGHNELKPRLQTLKNQLAL
ncbi:uncharacterized protein LOC134310032 [Trichomycterus rosablanca]|uniref:uncharacterized protein LOC134310032 n=1 Tax=Trichomycterus rosablanca TaxID=2290929 RepID=UPI002F3609AA